MHEISWDRIELLIVESQVVVLLIDYFIVCLDYITVLLSTFTSIIFKILDSSYFLCHVVDCVFFLAAVIPCTIFYAWSGTYRYLFHSFLLNLHVFSFCQAVCILRLE